MSINISTPIARIYEADLCPSEGKIPKFFEDQFQLRKYEKFTGQNEIVFADIKEPIWWNRPQIEDTNTAWRLEKDGLYSCNLPISFGKEKRWKSNYNILVNKNNIPIGIQLKFKHELSASELKKLKCMSFSIILKTLLALGVQEKDLCVLNNDLLLKGKKFVGSESVCTNTIYTECIYITLKYEEEKEIFNRLTSGKVAATAHKQITGLLDEYPEITRKQFLKICSEEFKKYLEQFEL